MPRTFGDWSSNPVVQRPFKEDECQKEIRQLRILRLPEPALPLTCPAFDDVDELLLYVKGNIRSRPTVVVSPVVAINLSLKCLSRT